MRSLGSKTNFSFAYLPAQSHLYVIAFRICIKPLSTGSDLRAQKFLFHFLLPGFKWSRVSVIFQNAPNAVISSNVSTINMNSANHSLKYKTANIKDNF